MTTSALTKKAVSAVENAVRMVILDHRKRQRALAIWKNGKVVMVPPESATATVREKAPMYGKR